MGVGVSPYRAASRHISTQKPGQQIQTSILELPFSILDQFQERPRRLAGRFLLEKLIQYFGTCGATAMFDKSVVGWIATPASLRSE